MFYGQGPDPDLNDESRWSFGPISISLKQLVIGLLSSIVVIPYNLLIVTIFRNSRAKEDQTSLTAATRQDLRQGKSQTKTLDQIFSDKNKKRHLQEKVNIESKSLKTNNTGCKNCSSSDNGRTIEHKTVEVDRMNNSYSYISCNKTNDNNNNNNNSKNYNNINIQSTNDSNGNSINDTKIDNDNKPNVSLDEVTVSMYDQEVEESKKGKKTRKVEKDKAKRQKKDLKRREKMRKKRAWKAKKAKGLLPYWCIYIAWGLCVAGSVTAALFILFYSMMWRTVKSNEWLTSMVISFVHDTFVSQPLKVICLALVFALIIRKPIEEELEDLEAEEGK